MRLISAAFTRLGRIRARAALEDGFTMVIAMGALMIGSLFVVSAYAAVLGDLPAAGKDQDRKAAYAAAEAGINYYLFHLNQDNAYWSKCTAVPNPGPNPNSNPDDKSPVNNAWDGTGNDPRQWRTLPGSSAKYTIELLPANGYAQCVAGTDASMIDGATGSFRIRATGQVKGTKRSIVTTFKRRGFLDYLYHTDYETLDPIFPGNQNCKIYHSAGRSWPCTDIQFITGDSVNGPLHTNDSLLVCGSPTFGRRSSDSIEEVGAYWSGGQCSATPNFVGTHKPGAPALNMPTSNTSLSAAASSSYRFTGTTWITLNGANMTVTNANLSPNTQTMALPGGGGTNAVIYVQNGTCTRTYSLKQTYNDPAGCADTYVKGTYTQDLTIASATDIIVNGSIINGSDAVLGLIPANFARVYHPVTWDDNNNCQSNASGSLTSPEIDAALLALQDSFIVDNYACGAQLGTLTVKGAIAQEFRGPVGTGGGGGQTGYLKNYTYDDRFHVRNPPFFLDPVLAAWQVRRQTELVPAR